MTPNVGQGGSRVASVADILEQAKAFHRAGDARTAEQFYRRVLQAEPAHAEAHYLLGAACVALGRADDALAHLRQSAVLEPSNAETHHYLGALLAQRGLLNEAIASFQEAARLRPSAAPYADSLRQARTSQEHGLGLAAAARGDLAEAARCFQRAAGHSPDSVSAHLNLGTILAEQGKLDEAVACLQRALELQPDHIDAQANLGVVLERQGRWTEAEACFRRALARRPDSATLHNSLGAVTAKQSRLDEAIVSFRCALKLQPILVDALKNLGLATEQLGRLEEAAQCFQQVAQLAPQRADSHYLLGGLLTRQGRAEEGVACCRRALELQPACCEAHHNLGLALARQGHYDAARASFHEALAHEPRSATVHSITLLALHYLPGVTLAELAASHRQYDDRHAAPLRAAWRPHENSPESERTLRIGFVSADLCVHPVGSFLIRLLENLDRSQFDTVCYHDRGQRDAMTARLQANASAWRDVAPLDEEQLADRVRADRIDILFDLAGHTASNRLLTFARKPAPVQISWMGYVGTTGLGAMDYLLADRHEVPVPSETFYRERILRLPQGYVCYEPPAYAPPIVPLPASQQGFVTFGSFNNPVKITTEVVDAWAAILRRVATSRLVLKYAGWDEPLVARQLVAMFAARGVAANRLELLGRSPHEALLRAYQRIDIALDTFPYNGGLTTCEALWMGVPVLTFSSETFAGRHSLSHLSNVGLGEWISDDVNDYVERAVLLSADIPCLVDLRQSLRDRMAASPLCDGPRFAEDFGHLLRTAWRQWCAAQPSR
jgi:predicted O-linked N-acetylglucosamine transferase (SPINDLY family)